MNETEINERFMNLNPEALQAIREYHATHKPELVHTIVNGIVEKYLPAEMRNRASEAMKSPNAFGIESVTLMEIMLDIQDALGIEITDNELRGLKNFDDATNLLRQKVAALSSKS